MIKMYAIIVALMLSTRALAGVECQTDCHERSKFKYPCPTFKKPYRKCKAKNPALFSSCMTIKTAKCRVTKPILKKLSKVIARDPFVVHKARNGGWTKGSCATVGGSTIAIAAIIWQAPICVAVGATVGAPACFAFIAGSAATIADLTCTQLCHDQHLQDCRE